MGQAVRYRATTWLRAHAAAAAAVAVIVTMTLAPALALLAGAHRTATAPDRYSDSQAVAFDVSIYQAGGTPMATQIAALPGVEHVAQTSFVFGAIIPDDGSGPLDALTFAGDLAAINGRVGTGRNPDPSAPGEFVASDSWMALGEYRLGDTFSLTTVSEESASRDGYNAAFDGPTVTATLVGVFDDRAQSLNDSFPLVMFGRSLLDAYAPGAIGVSDSPGVVDLAPGVGLQQLRRELDTLPNGAGVSVQPFELLSQPVLDAVATQSDALWVLAAIAAAATAVVLTQLLVRLVRTSEDDRASLSALGYTHRQSVAETAFRALPVVLVGVAGASVVAWLCSRWFPYGFARVLEPDPGARIDWVVQGTAAPLAVGLLLATTALFTSDRSGRTGGRHRSIDRLATKLPSATAGTGTRFAFGRSRRSGSIDGFLLGLGAVLTVAVAALTVGSSLGHLLDTPANWGGDADVGYGQGGSIVPDEVLRVLGDDPDVAAVTLLGATTVAVGSDPLGVVGFSAVEGGHVPATLGGRLPQAADEVALGARAADRLGVGIGDRLTVTAPAGRLVLSVVGLAVVPGVEEVNGMGDAALVDEDGLLRLDPSEALSSAAIYYAADAPPGATDRLSAALGADAIGPEDRPAAIVNLDRVRDVPLMIVAVVGILALVSLAQITATAARRRRHDIAVLQALGATSAWCRRVIHWQATALALAASALAVPVGIVVGRTISRRYPEQIGAPIRPDVPVVWIALLVAAMLAVANVSAAAAARRRAPARDLGVE